MHPCLRAALTLAACGTLMATTTPRARADEGMWLFNNPPLKLLKEKYKFEPPAGWFDHVQKSSVRFNSGGSGSFVSPDGLVMTNHHVALETLQKVSSKGKDYVKDGFLAKKHADEIKAVDLELNVLMTITDVTKDVQAAVGNLSGDKAFEARRAVIAKISAEAEKKTGLRSDVVTLYQGGQYHLYSFKRYTDVRLVFAPEQQIAFYGGDPDNFAFPRYDLDVCFFRVYEDGKPAKVEHYLKWSKDGAKDNELIFVSGHPGKTDRLTTVAELEYLRDVGFPFLLQRLYRWEVLLSVYSAQGDEYERKAKDLLFSIANSRKARDGGLAGLLDPSVMKAKKDYEAKLKKAVAKSDDLKDFAGAWDEIAKVQALRAANIKKYTVLEGAAAFNTPLFGYARTLVRAADEFAKPNEERLPEFGETDKKSLELRLFSKRPIYTDLEIVKLADSLTFMAEILGTKDKLVQQVLAGKSPRERAAELINGTKLLDVKARQELYKGGKDAVAASKDPLIQVAKIVDKESRTLRKLFETKLEEVKRQAYDKIAKAKFAVEGTDVYPDATFTLRLAFGTVKGYTENGKKIPFETTLGGLYEYAKEKGNKGVFELPQRWVDRKSRLNLKTSFNFVSTADIIGGNSGSPVINTKGEVVGLIFDGNIQSLVWDFLYTEEQARAVSVSSPGIIEALRAVYDAEDLATEIVGKK